MALPRLLKAFQLFGERDDWIDEVPTCELPELARNMVEYRGGGMDGAVMIDQGQNEIEFQYSVAGILEEPYDTYGSPEHDAAQLRFEGSYESEEEGRDIPVRITVRGRNKTLGGATAESGPDDANSQHTMSCSYYKLEIDGREKIEIDIPGHVFRVNGTDRLSQRRRNIGMN